MVAITIWLSVRSFLILLRAMARVYFIAQALSHSPPHLNLKLFTRWGKRTGCGVYLVVTVLAGELFTRVWISRHHWARLFTRWRTLLWFRVRIARLVRFPVSATGFGWMHKQ